MMMADKYALHDRVTGFDECDNAFFPPNPIGTMDLLGNLHRKEDFDWTYAGDPKGAAEAHAREHDPEFSSFLGQLRLIGKLDKLEEVEEMFNAE